MHPKVIKQLVLYDRFNKKFVVDTYQADDGHKFDWVYIDSPNSGIIVALTAENKVLLIKQYRFNLNIYTYENPAGGSEKNENPIDTAKRELFEETGYETSEMLLIGRYYNMPGESNRWVNIFLAKNVVKKSEPPLDTDVEKYFDMSVKVVSFSEAESKMQGLEHLFALSLAKKHLKL